MEKDLLSRLDAVTQFGVAGHVAEKYCIEAAMVIRRLMSKIEELDVNVADLESENENLQIEHDVMFARIRDANEQYTPEEVSGFIDAEIKAKRAESV